MSTRFYEQDENVIKNEARLEVYDKLTKAEAQKDEAQTAWNALAEERDTKTKELYAQLKTIEEKIKEIDDPLRKQLEMKSSELSKIKQGIESMEKALNFWGAMDLIRKGVVTKEDAQKVIKLLLGSHREPEIREVSHKRDDKIHVWAFSDDYDYTAYFATNKNSWLSAVICGKAHHIGDWTTNKEYACKEKVELSRSSYRSGMTMREWLDPEKVEWKGMKVTDIIAFCNNVG